MDIKRKLLGELLDGKITLKEFKREITKNEITIFITPDDDSFDENKPVSATTHHQQNPKVFKNFEELKKHYHRECVIVEQADEQEA